MPSLEPTFHSDNSKELTSSTLRIPQEDLSIPDETSEQHFEEELKTAIDQTELSNVTPETGLRYYTKRSEVLVSQFNYERQLYNLNPLIPTQEHIVTQTREKVKSYKDSVRLWNTGKHETYLEQAKQSLSEQEKILDEQEHELRLLLEKQHDLESKIELCSSTLEEINTSDYWQSQSSQDTSQQHPRSTLEHIENCAQEFSNDIRKNKYDLHRLVIDNQRERNSYEIGLFVMRVRLSDVEVVRAQLIDHTLLTEFTIEDLKNEESRLHLAIDEVMKMQVEIERGIRNNLTSREKISSEIIFRKQYKMDIDDLETRLEHINNMLVAYEESTERISNNLKYLQEYSAKLRAVHKQELPEDLIQEALEFNKLLSEGKVSAHYLSLIKEDQTPEQVEAIVASAMEKVRPINDFGTLYHETYVTEHDLKNIISEGLKSKSQLLRSSSFTGGLHGISQFPDYVSFSMNLHQPKGITTPSTERELLPDYDPHIHKVDKVGCSLLLNPAFIREYIKQGGTLHFVGSRFFHPELQENIINYIQENKWCNEPTPKHPDTAQEMLNRFLERDYHHFWGRNVQTATPQSEEVLIHPPSPEYYNEPPIDSMVIDHSVAGAVISWVNDQVNIRPEKAIPIYDHAGNLLWPIRLEREKVVEHYSERQQTKRQEMHVVPLSESLSSLD